MPFDGIATKCIITELQEKLIGARIQNIYMPEKDEVVLSLYNDKNNYKLVMSANPSCSRIHLTTYKKENPKTPPNFCMFLRKHIASGRILAIQFHNYERLIDFIIESRNELRDMQQKRLIVELTGRNCNVIVTNNNNIILDSLKHIDEAISSKRQIMPAREYSLPPAQDKVPIDIFKMDMLLKHKTKKIADALLSTLKGFSPVICREICEKANIDSTHSFEQLSKANINELKIQINIIRDILENNNFSPCIIFDGNKPKDFYPITLTTYKKVVKYNSFNDALEDFYTIRDTYTRTAQKQGNIKRILTKNIERCQKKIMIHSKNINNTDRINKYKLFGELIIANIHNFDILSDKMTVTNYYNNEIIQIPIEKGKDASYNSKRYFKKYKRAKSAAAHSKEELIKVKQELSYLESVMHNLFQCTLPEDVDTIKDELTQTGYIKKNIKSKRKIEKKLAPIKYISSEGYEIYVGRNNIENDYLTFKFANSRDLWLHAKGIPGSHVIIRKKDKTIDFFPDQTITEAAIIAAYHSRAKLSGQIAIDYSEVKNIKKPNASPPGFVNYFTYFSAYATANEDIINKLKEKQTY